MDDITIFPTVWFRRILPIISLDPAEQFSNHNRENTVYDIKGKITLNT